MHLMLDDLYPAMPWADIDAVVFDVGNVLLRWNAEDILHRLLPDRPDLHGELLTRVLRSPYWTMRDRDSITREEAIAAMCRTAPTLEPYVRRIMEGWGDMPEMPEGIDVLMACKAHGKRVFALSNYPEPEFTQARQSHAFFGLFDGIVVSSAEKIIKPSLEIYARLTFRHGLDPARTLFIDDSPANVEAALEFGLQALCFDRAGKLAHFFAD